MNATRTLVAIATYNEIENLPRLVDEILRIAPDVDILVIDDNSPDGTGRWCDAHQDGRLRCLHRAGKMGLGSATVAGFEYALAEQYAFVLTMDADFSHDPQHIPELLECLRGGSGKESDVAIGSRYVRGGNIVGWPWHRRFMSRVINAYTRTVLGLQVSDCSGAFRCYRTQVLREVGLHKLTSSGYSYLEEILWLLRRNGADFTEIPITFTDRQLGKSKINLQEAMVAVWTITTIGMRRFRR